MSAAKTQIGNKIILDVSINIPRIDMTLFTMTLRLTGAYYGYALVTFELDDTRSITTPLFCI